MPQAFVTVWDSFTNEIAQEYVSVPAGPVLTRSMPVDELAKLVHIAVCEAGGEDPKDWNIVEHHFYKDLDVLVMVMEHTNEKVIATYNVRFHF